MFFIQVWLKLFFVWFLINKVLLRPITHCEVCFSVFFHANTMHKKIIFFSVFHVFSVLGIRHTYVFFSRDFPILQFFSLYLPWLAVSLLLS